MKKISTILLKVLLVLCVLTSCKKDEEEAKPVVPVKKGIQKITLLNAYQDTDSLDVWFDAGNFPLINNIKYGTLSKQVYVNYIDSTLITVIKHSSQDTILKKYIKLYDYQPFILSINKRGNEGEVNIFEDSLVASEPAFTKAAVSFINLIEGVKEVEYKRVGNVTIPNFPMNSFGERTSFREVDFGIYKNILLKMIYEDGTEGIFILPEFLIGGGGKYTVLVSGSKEDIDINVIEHKKADQSIAFIKYINAETRSTGKVTFSIDGKIIAELSGKEASDYIPVSRNSIGKVKFPDDTIEHSFKYSDYEENEHFSYLILEHYKKDDKVNFRVRRWNDEKHLSVQSVASISFTNFTPAKEFYDAGLPLDVTFNEINLFSEVTTNSTKYGTISPGSYQVKIQSPDHSTTYLTKSLIIEEGKLYSFILTGTYNESTNTLELQSYHH